MSGRMPFDPSLYLVFDPNLTGAGDARRLVEAAIAGGVTLVQLRDKRGSTRTLIELARSLKPVLAARGVPLIINDRVDVALAVGADGVHLGQSDMPPPEARRLLARDALIGLSVTNTAQAAGADPAVIDYVGVGPLFATATKPDASAPLGIAGFAELRRLLPFPVVAIGGIQAGNAGDIIRAGADGVAVVSAICAATDPRQAAHALSTVIGASRGEAGEAAAAALRVDPDGHSSERGTR